MNDENYIKLAQKLTRQLYQLEKGHCFIDVKEHDQNHIIIQSYHTYDWDLLMILNLSKNEYLKDYMKGK